MHSARPRPYKLRIGIEGDGVKGAGAEVGTDGTRDAVEKSLATRVDTDEWLRGEKATFTCILITYYDDNYYLYDGH
jgi:hypothetical protein